MSEGFFGQPKATPKAIPPEVEHQVDLVSAEAGFLDREPLKAPPKRRRGTSRQLHNFTMRLHMDDAEKFIRWCEAERIAYREGFGRLVAAIEKGVV